MTSLSRSRGDCRLCHSTSLQKSIPLNPLPVASPNVGAQAKIQESAPADVYRCLDCGALQLLTMVDPEFQYRNFKYTTGLSAGLADHFRTLINELAASGEIDKGRFVFDIGSNDGALLRLAREHGARVLGIDPAVDIAEAATQNGMPTIGEFFCEKIGRDIRVEYGGAQVIISANTVANIDDLDDFLAGINEVLAKDGIFVVETQYALDILQRTLLDVIYHEHISYFAVRPMRIFLERHGMELVDAERIAPKGGAVRFYIQKKGGPRAISARVGAMEGGESAAGLYDDHPYNAFNDRIRNLGGKVRAKLDQSRRETGRALAFGSSVGCAALIQYLDLGASIDALFDDQPLVNYLPWKDGIIPILSGAQLTNEAPADVAVLAWRYADLISAKHTTFRGAGGRFYTVLPEVRMVTD